MTALEHRLGSARLRIEGQGDEVLLMLHGWPDTLALWEGTVQALQSRYVCARLSWPGFEPGSERTAMTVDALCACLDQALALIGPDRPVTLMLHDWGCVFGYEYAMRRPERVARVVAVDVGDHQSRSLWQSWGWREKLAVIGYQLWLALAWQLGGALGDRMTRAMARWLRCPAPAEGIHSGMNYPYAMRWFGVAGGMRGLQEVRLPMPLLYVYGARKPFMFHSERWLDAVARKPGSAVQGLPCGHWVMQSRPVEFVQCVAQWLDQRH